MADDDSLQPQQSFYKAHQETFQQRPPGQEASVEHRFPAHNPAGIVQLPRGSRGPRSLYLKRGDDGFGFTLRHFIIYPPDSVTEIEKHAVAGSLETPVETIFVQHVKDNSPARRAGLQHGDRILAVNNIDVLKKTYKEVVALISRSPEYLHLLVVPKEDDVLQQLFSTTAYNPISNQAVPTTPELERLSAKQFLTHQFTYNPREFKADPVSWSTLQNPYLYNNSETSSLGERNYSQPNYYHHNRPAVLRTQRSADNILSERDQQQYQEIYAEIPNEVAGRLSSRHSKAQPQVPLYRKMGRRASDGLTISDSADYPSGGYTDKEMRAINYKSNYLPDAAPASDGTASLPTVINYPNSAGCRLSLDVGRRDSSPSLGSSRAEGSKDSLSSYDSGATLTGHETDDSAILTRLRLNAQRKAEFLRGTSTAKEFYAQPKKLDRPMWPPVQSTEPVWIRQSDLELQQQQQRSKPTHQNFTRVKNDIENERDLVQSQVTSGGGAAANATPQPKNAKSPNNLKINTNVAKLYEASTAPDFGNCDQAIDDRRMYPPQQQIVYKKAKEFETGKGPDDDLVLSNKADFSKSELARLSSKKLVPNVTERAQEYETRSMEPRRDPSGTSTASNASALKKFQRDSRSLDSSDVSVSEAIKMRARSNSAESWVAALRSDNDKKAKDYEAMDMLNSTDITTAQPPHGDLPPLIPVPVERFNLMPSVSITPAPSSAITSSLNSSTAAKAIRPTQLDLDGPIRPSRHLKPSSTTATDNYNHHRSISSDDDKPVVVKRRQKSASLADDERPTRRESYQRATEGGRMHIDSDISDGDISPQVLRSAHRRWRPPMFLGDIQQLRKLFEDGASSLGGSASGNSSSSASLEKVPASPLDKYGVIKEGSVHCKILEIDGKRASDRSWKPVFIILKGPQLFLFKERHHQSPMGTSDSLDQSLSSGVDMRTSVVRVAEDYHKRKNVLRVSAVKPCRSEFLLQAESTEDFADWVKTLQEQVAASTDAELDSNHSRQQAVPQLTPASTTIQVQGSHLSPQFNKNKNSSIRNRSPTGQSPVSKSRKPTQLSDASTSPKSKTWRGRMAKQFKKIHQGASSPSSPTAPEGSTFGIPLDQCLPSLENPYVPRFVKVCTDIVEKKGLQTVGIYRVPGNNALINALTDETNKIYDDVPQDDPRWGDLHVVSSLLKSYFRKMPDSLVTANLYPKFIKADKIEDPKMRMEELKKLVKSLPPHNYHTLKHVIQHLNKVVENSDVNRMEAKNLAIVFGPTIVRPEGENMENLVNDMMNQCKIVETLLTNSNWFFSDSDVNDIPIPLAIAEDLDVANSQALLDNIAKYEAMTKDTKEKNGALLSSILSAAQRVKRKTRVSTSLESKGEPTSPVTLMKGFTSHPELNSNENDLKDVPDDKSIPTTVTERNPMGSKNKPYYNYYTDRDAIQRRVEIFKQETLANLQRPRTFEISVNHLNNLSSSASNVSHMQRQQQQQQHNRNLPMQPNELLTKTHSASNVYSRRAAVSDNNNTNSNNNNNNNNRSSLNAISSGGGGGGNGDRSITDQNVRRESDVRSTSINNNHGARGNVRRVSSIENINAQQTNIASLKKVKYEPAGSMESLNKQSATDDESDLVAAMTKLYDEKLKEKQKSILSGEDLPFVDESPDKRPSDSILYSDKENIPRASSDLYKNPLLHKSPKLSMNNKKEETKSGADEEKDEDTTTSQDVPDNERLILTNKLTLQTHNSNNNSNFYNIFSAPSSKLKRSESLNKPERTVSPHKLKRSESLNKTGSDRLKRSDSLTKNEKTENNLNKRRELFTNNNNNNNCNNRRSKDSKLKRKNGMPDRSIKRRHTVGGTKDPDKVTWLDNKYQEEFTSTKENGNNEKLRTSSPDLSSMRRDRLFVDINLIEAEIRTLRQHLNGTRPQSFPEAFKGIKVPLESHV